MFALGVASSGCNVPRGLDAVRVLVNGNIIKIVSSTDGFLVELVFATKVPSFGAFGSVRARLPRPDFLVTESRWDLFVPEGFHCGRPSTNMELVLQGRGVSREELASQLGPDFRIHVPSAGRIYAFEMLYANHGDVETLRRPKATKNESPV